MRKVLFKMWIPAEWPEGTNSANQNRARPLPGTNCWEGDFKHEGVFHQWGSAYTEFESGAGNYTVALVETPNGCVSEILPSNIKFVEPAS